MARTHPYPGKATTTTTALLLEQEDKRLKEMVADLAFANELLKKGRAGTCARR
ncbi:MAG TPA: hypothetical protein VNI77_03135 [Nitrososphaera sp.]|nr:hypothetical protein [Nitrososphaera sp.]